MKKVSIVLALALVLVSGLALVGCKNGTTDDSLNGTWTSTDGSGDQLILDNGKFTLKMDGTEQIKGTYKASATNITFTVTDINFVGEFANFIPGVTGWKSKNQLITFMTEVGAGEDDMAELLAVFEPQTISYTLNGDTLVIEELWGTFTRS